MANSNEMFRTDAEKNHVGAKMLVLDSAGDVGQISLLGRVMAWVNFDGTLSSLSPRASANVSSITDQGTGQYRINFAMPMPDANFCVLMPASVLNNHARAGVVGQSNLSVNYVEVQVANAAGSSYDKDCVTVCVVR